jgi:hypothetical protein
VVIFPIFGQPPSMSDILNFQKELASLEQVKPNDPSHFFTNSMYLRELTIKKGTIVVGKTHKQDHFFMVLTGKAIVVSEFGREIIESGYISISKAGAKRVFYAIEDTSLGGCPKTHLSARTALKFGSKCSFTPVNCAFSPNFALF